MQKYLELAYLVLVLLVMLLNNLYVKKDYLDKTLLSIVITLSTLTMITRYIQGNQNMYVFIMYSLLIFIAMYYIYKERITKKA